MMRLRMSIKCGGTGATRGGNNGASACAVLRKPVGLGPRLLRGQRPEVRVSSSLWANGLRVAIWSRPLVEHVPNDLQEIGEDKHSDRS